MRVLNVEEIMQWAKEHGYYAWDLISLNGCNLYIKGIGISAKAQHQQDLKDFIEWGMEECEHVYRKEQYVGWCRRNCPVCWELLKQLMEEK